MSEKLNDNRYIALPVDADGIPIHVGDLVVAKERSPITLMVTSIRYQGSKEGWIICAKEFCSCSLNVDRYGGSELRHVQECRQPIDSPAVDDAREHRVPQLQYDMLMGLCDILAQVCEQLQKRNEDLLDLLRDARDEYVAKQPDDDYMPLPKDSDGLPIHIGDVVTEHEDGHTFEVDGYEYAQAGPSGKKWWVFHTDGICAVADDCTHYKPQTVEDVLEELEGMRGSGADYEDVVMRCADLAEALRMLLKKED